MSTSHEHDVCGGAQHGEKLLSSGLDPSCLWTQCGEAMVCKNRASWLGVGYRRLGAPQDPQLLGSMNPTAPQNSSCSI